MARVFYHEHPRQAGTCLPGSFDAYVRGIPVADGADLNALWQDIRNRPFQADWGAAKAGCNRRLMELDADGHTGTCSPPQRSRVWPPRMNCWEATAHFVAAASRKLPEDWAIHVWDRDLPNGARHVWPSLVTPGGDHLLVDLNSTAQRSPLPRPYTGLILPEPAANDAEQVGKDVLGGLHIVGGGLLKAFGLGQFADTLEEVEGDALPDFARSKKAKPSAPPAPEPATPRPPAPVEAAEPPPPQDRSRVRARAYPRERPRSGSRAPSIPHRQGIRAAFFGPGSLSEEPPDSPRAPRNPSTGPVRRGLFA